MIPIRSQIMFGLIVPYLLQEGGVLISLTYDEGMLLLSCPMALFDYALAFCVYLDLFIYVNRRNDFDIYPCTSHHFGAPARLDATSRLLPVASAKSHTSVPDNKLRGYVVHPMRCLDVRVVEQRIKDTTGVESFKRKPNDNLPHLVTCICHHINVFPCLSTLIF